MSEPELSAIARALPALSEEARHESTGRLRGALVAFERDAQPDAEIDAGQARDAWSALVAGDAALLHSFESDGRRYLVVRPSRPGARERGALSPLEVRALVLRARCASFKLIAYELGLSAAAAHGLVQKGLSKLGIRNENELPSLLAPASSK